MLHRRFQGVIERGIENIAQDLQGTLIANLTFPNENKLEIYFQGEEKSIAGEPRTYPKFSVSVGGDTYEWTAQWRLSSPAGKNDIQFSVVVLWSAPWLFLKELDSDEDIISLTNFSLNSALPRINGVDGHVCKHWFLSGNLENPEDWCGQDWCDEEFRDSWKRIRLDGTNFVIDEFPALPTITINEEENDGVEAQEFETQRDWAKFIIILICWRFILVHGSAKPERGQGGRKRQLMQILGIDDNGVSTFYESFPRLSDYLPTRPVDIDASRISNAIGQDEGLQVPWHVVVSATAALNAGKHIIFTGPPGCGKTSIASSIARQASRNRKPLMTTASQSWSTDEVIGRYMPTLDGKGLEFKEGFFLKALAEERWLIIDEINRCDIDNCFGELFTILSGQSVTLPFEKVSEDGSRKSIRVAVGEEDEDPSQYEYYLYSDSFRLLATMNDSDVAGLNQLSYALRRRFAIIRIDAPGTERRRAIFSRKIQESYNENGELRLENYIYRVENTNFTAIIDFKNPFLEKLKSLFASEGSDLIDLGVVGIAPVLDIIKFVSEGLRAPSSEDGGRYLRFNNNDNNATDGKRFLLRSCLAMGLVLNVFPQLDAVTGEIENRFKPAVRCIQQAFAENDRFLRIERNNTNDVLELIDSQQTIREYLAEELRRQYATDPTILDVIEEVFAEEQENA